MIKLEYGNGVDNRELIGECKSIKEAFSKIVNYLTEIKYEPYYYRINYSDENGKEIWIDFGSYTKFFFVNGYSDDEYNEWRKEIEK